MNLKENGATSQTERRWVLFVIALCSMVAAAAMVAAGNSRIVGGVHAIVIHDYWVQSEHTVGPVTRVLRVDILLAWLITCLASVLFLLRKRVLSYNVFLGAITAASSWTLFVCLQKHGHERPWYPLATIIHDPANRPVFGHRPLFPWVALLLEKVFPFLSDLRSFFVVQAILCIVACYLAGLWAEDIVGLRYRVLGPCLLVLMLSPTFGYFNFYDIAIVCFFTAALLCLRRRFLVAFVVLVGLGTVNHENILLLIPIAAIILYQEVTTKTLFAVVLSALGAYVVARIFTAAVLPQDKLFDLRFWDNLYQVGTGNGMILHALPTYLFWGMAAFAGFADSNRFIRKCTLLLPMLALVTYLFGRFGETRQFDAFIPVMIAMVLSGVRAWDARFIRLQDRDSGTVARGIASFDESAA
jgi:hypothetical protein